MSIWAYLATGEAIFLVQAFSGWYTDTIRDGDYSPGAVAFSAAFQVASWPIAVAVFVFVVVNALRGPSS